MKKYFFTILILSAVLYISKAVAEEISLTEEQKEALSKALLDEKTGYDTLQH